MDEIDLDSVPTVTREPRQKRAKIKPAKSVKACIHRIDEVIDRLVGQIQYAENDIQRHNAVVMLMGINQLRVKVTGVGKTLPHSIVGYL